MEQKKQCAIQYDKKKHQWLYEQMVNECAEKAKCIAKIYSRRKDMKLILTKPGCKKCEYAKQTYDLSDWLIFDIENPTTFLDEHGMLATIDAMAEIALAQAYLVAFKALPLLVEDGKLVGISSKDIEEGKVKPLKVCNQYLKRKEG